MYTFSVYECELSVEHNNNNQIRRICTVFRLETRNLAPFRVNLVNYIFFQYQIFLQAMIAYFTANYNILNFKMWDKKKKKFPRGFFFSSFLKLGTSHKVKSEDWNGCEIQRQEGKRNGAKDFSLITKNSKKCISLSQKRPTAEEENTYGPFQLDMFCCVIQ